MPRITKSRKAVESLEKAMADFTENPMFRLLLLECERTAEAAMNTLTGASSPFDLGVQQGYAQGLHAYGLLVARAYNGEMQKLKEQESRDAEDSDDAAPKGDTSTAKAGQRRGSRDGGSANSYERARRGVERLGVAGAVHEN